MSYPEIGLNKDLYGFDFSCLNLSIINIYKGLPIIITIQKLKKRLYQLYFKQSHFSS